MDKKFLNFINGEFVEPISGKFFNNINPADKDQVLGSFPQSDEKDISLAVQSAKKALATWKSLPPPKRGEILYKVLKLMEARKDELVDIIVKEMGKTKAEATGDVQSGINMGLYMAGEGRRLYGKTSFSESEKKWVLTKKEPMGVCGLITPWNFPVANISWKTFPALICGNTVVLKPAEDTPWSASVFADILKDAGIPKGVFNLVHGYGEQAGAALVSHPDVNLISFTGSTEVGKSISQICAKRLCKVSLEMGGKNGVLVLDDADIDQAVESVAIGAFTMAGQRCASTSRLILQKNIHDVFLEKLIKKIETLKIGPGSDPKTKACPAVNQKQLNRIVNYVKMGKEEGARMFYRGKIPEGDMYTKGFYVEPVIFVGVKPDMRIWREEIFGPVLCVAKCDSFKQGLDLLNNSDYFDLIYQVPI